jgi:magnesium transporter
MRILQIQPGNVDESLGDNALAQCELPTHGFLWIACDRNELELMQNQIQTELQRLCGIPLVDLHISDLLNQQLPSRYDYTSQYDMLVFRRLTAGGPVARTDNASTRGGPAILSRIDTSPVGFAIFDRLLLTVHPAQCNVRDAFAAKLVQSPSDESRATGARPPTSPADLMLRLINQMVDGYLALRRELTRQLDNWQAELLSPKARLNNWSTMLDARLALHHLDEICEDQRSAIQDWIEAVETWPNPGTEAARRERDLLQVRGRDVLEHIERVVHHVRQLEHSAETAVQMHFSAQSHRTNDIMRTLTALTAIFLPLNLIAAIFGMNFEFVPFLHAQGGFWWAMGTMALIALTLALVFWRKRYLARTER